MNNNNNNNNNNNKKFALINAEKKDLQFSFICYILDVFKQSNGLFTNIAIFKQGTNRID